MHFKKGLTIATPLLLATACGSTSATDTGNSTDLLTTTVNVTPTLGQSVTVSPANPVSGTNITVRSVVTNRGSSAVALSSRICGLDYAGSLTLTHPPEVMKCAAYSQQGSLAPGDSVVTLDYMRVTSAAGSYVLRVKHALKPEAWAESMVQVKGR